MKTDKILHLVQQKKAMRSGGALPLPKAQTGMPVTTADSLRVFNAQMALNKFYADEARKGRLKLDSSISLSDGVWDLQRRTANELKNKNLDFYRGEISSRQNRRGHGPWDDLYEKYFNLTPQQLKRLEYQGIARTNSGTDNVFYYRDLITPLQNLASPFAVLDTRIKPQRIISYTPINDKDDQYPGGNVDVYDYDPLAVKPFYLRTPQEQKQWEEKYGKTKVTSASSPRLTAARKPETMQLMKSIPSRFESSDIDMQPVGRPVPPIPTRPEMYMDMRGEWMMKPAISDSVLMNDPRFIQKSGYRKSEKKSGGLAKAQKGIVNQNAYDLWYKYNTPEGRAGIPDLYSDYDYRKYFEDAVTGVNPMGFDEESMHFPDTYKYPWHPSFSDESVYYVNQKETPGLSYQTKQKGGLTKHQSRGQVIPDSWIEAVKGSYINPFNWGVPDYSNVKNFSKAYEQAKKAGEEEFLWNGKRYNTKYAGTPRQEVGAYGVQGKPVHPMDLNDPAQVNLYPPFGKYLPGHIAASIGDNQTSVDYRPAGNIPYGLDKVKNKGEKSFNVYGQDNLTFSNKAASLPTGDYMLEDEYRPSDWNLFTNNCADNVCDAFGIPRSKGIQTPKGAMQKIQEKYPTLDVTGRTYEDYYDLAEKTRNIANMGTPAERKKLLTNYNNLIGIASSPDLQSTEASRNFGTALQVALSKEGYDLSNSIKSNGNFDGVIGPETLNALKDWQSKNAVNKKAGGLAKAQNGLPVNNPHLPNTPLATGAAESVMGLIDYFLLPSQLPLKAATALGRGAITLAEILNPLGGFRPSTDMLYRGIGKEGFEDAMESGVLRAAQHNYPAKRSIAEIVNSPKQFDKVYYSPDAEAAMRYGQGYVAAVPKTAADFVNRYKGKGKDWSQLTSRQIPIKEATFYQKYPIVGYKKKFKFQDAGESGLPKMNPHLPNTALATGAATPTMSPIDVAIAAMTGAGLVPSAVKLSKSILNAQPEDRRWMNSMIPFWEAHIANNTRETYEKARDMYKNANKKQTGGEESGLQYVPSGDYGRYYDPETKEYVPQVYLPDVEISASKDLPFQNNKFAPFLAARGMAKYVPLETIFLPGTPVVKGLGKVGNVLLDAVNPLAGMRNLKSSIPDYTPSPAYVEALERLNQTRAKYLDELNKLQESPQVGKSLGDITADIDALNASIKPRSEATTGDLQNMLDQLRSINANLEQHVPLHRRAFTSSDISEQLARQAQDPGDMPGTGVSDVGEAMSMQDRIKNFEDIQRQEGIGLSAKYLGTTPQGARFEFVPEKYMIEAKGLTGKGTTVKPEDFYTTSELQKKIDQLAAYNRAQAQFDEMNPLTGADMVMSALSGDKSRDELFQTLFPNVSIPNFNEKIIPPQYMSELRESLKYLPSQYFQDPLNPKRTLKWDLQNKMREDSMPKSLADYLAQKSKTWHKEDPLGYAREMMGVNKIEGLSMDEIRRLAESKQNELTDWYRQRLLQDFGKPFTAGDAVRLGLNPNKLGGLTKSKAREILHDKSVHGHPLTDKQRKFFGAIASGKSYKVRVKKNKQ